MVGERWTVRDRQGAPCVTSPTGRRHFPQEESSVSSNLTRRTKFAHVDQRQESPPSKRGQCSFESNRGHQTNARMVEDGRHATLKPSWGNPCRIVACCAHQITLSEPDGKAPRLHRGKTVFDPRREYAPLAQRESVSLTRKRPVVRLHQDAPIHGP